MAAGHESSRINGTIPFSCLLAGSPGNDNHFLARVFPPPALSKPAGFLRLAFEKCRASFDKQAVWLCQDAPAKWAAQEISVCNPQS
jgi:hypothetical protein